MISTLELFGAWLVGAVLIGLLSGAILRVGGAWRPEDEQPIILEADPERVSYVRLLGWNLVIGYLALAIFLGVGLVLVFLWLHALFI